MSQEELSQMKEGCQLTRQMNISTGWNKLHIKYINTAGGLLWPYLIFCASFMNVLWRANGLLEQQASFS